MRISFATTSAARAAASILEQYGFSANQSGKEVVTNCPTLLAAPAIERSIGLELVEGHRVLERRTPQRDDLTRAPPAWRRLAGGGPRRPGKAAGHGG